MSRGLRRARNVADLRLLARQRLPRSMFHYIDGGSEDETSLARNLEVFADYQLLPRYLVDVSRIDTSTTVLGQPIDWPVILAPTGMSRLFHHDGERAVARAAAKAGTLYSLSTMASVSLEEVAASAPGPKCFQIYAFRDRELTREFINRARDAGYKALCLTIDVPLAGNRERDLATGMTLPPKLTMMSLLDTLAHPRWCWNYARTAPLKLANVAHKIGEASDAQASTLVAYVNNQFDRSVTWGDVGWMIEQWQGPFAIKGILSALDAKRAVDIGATAVMISNHGGRQLDGVPAPLDVLPAIVEVVGDRAEIIVDGGIRRGVHVLKALALGARACMIGRAYLYGLGAGGEAGVTRALTLLRSEIERDMALLGVASLKDLSREFIQATNR